MQNIFRVLNAARKDPPDNCKFANNFITLHLIKVQFILGNFKQCKALFGQIERAGEAEKNLLPPSWHVGVSYF